MGLQPDLPPCLILMSFSYSITDSFREAWVLGNSDVPKTFRVELNQSDVVFAPFFYVGH
jgi:hypothetical protein